MARNDSRRRALDRRLRATSGKGSSWSDLSAGFFNPKAKIDSKQVIDRTPKVDDFRDIMMKYGKQSRLRSKRGY